MLLLDTLGELARLYALASVVFVGKSLVSFGGHNIVEPAAAGRPVVVGPHMENFQEIADEFLAEDALVQVKTAEELGREVGGPDARRAAPRAPSASGPGAVVERNRGAVRQDRRCPRGAWST